MARRRKYPKPKRKSSSPRAKPIKLNPTIWLRKSDIPQWRDKELLHQEGMCSVTGLPLNPDNSVADHCHSDGQGVDGRMRGVLLGEANSLEGMFLKRFKKFKMDSKFGLDFPTFLISLGEYLQQDNSKGKFHYTYMTDLRDHIKRLNRKEIVDKLYKEFNIRSEVTESHGELVRLYVQAFVDLLEFNEINKEKLL